MKPILLRTDVRDVAILHWAVTAETVAGLLPPGLEPDLVDGRAWVGMLALRNEDVRPLGTRVPGRVGSYPQVNVRLYARRPGGRTGVVFVSMEAGGALAAWTGRWGVGLPYRWRGIPVSRRGDLLEYGSRLRMTVGAAPSADPVVRTLLEHAGGLFVRRAGQLWWVADEHPPWPLQEVGAVSVGPPPGTPVPDRQPDSAVYSPGVQMTLRPPERLR